MTLYEYVEDVYLNLINKGIQLNDETLSIIESTSFDEIVKNDDLCIKLIKSVMEFSDEVSRDNRHRASHILVTWLLGIGLGPFFKINNLPGPFGKLYFSRIWLQSAMLHDYGYLCKELQNKNLQLSELTNEYNLLTDNYKEEFLRPLNGMTNINQFKPYFTYTYDEIKKYYGYSKSFLSKLASNPNNEFNDHGITGACLAFNKSCKNIKKRVPAESSIILQIQKIACITTASHNMYKSSDKKDDDSYLEFGLDGMTSTAPKRIFADIKSVKKADKTEKEDTDRALGNNLLLLLSLVDTIECTKRFSKKENDKEYLIQNTTLKYVEINFDESSISIDFSNLYDYINTKRKSVEMRQRLDRHIEGLLDINNWTAFKSNRISKDEQSAIKIWLEG